MKENSVYCITILGMLLLGLSGCSSVPQQQSAPQPYYGNEKAIRKAWKQHEQHLMTLHHWTIQGRASIQARMVLPSITFSWSYQRPLSTFSFWGPFGQLLGELDSRPGHTTLSIPGASTLTGHSAEEVVFHATSYSLPLAHLPFWIKGIPAPADQHHPISEISLNPQGRIERFTQGKWEIQYQKYIIHSGWILPSIISIHSSKIHLKAFLFWQIEPYERNQSTM